jgi:hypothetical protein
MEVGEGPVKVGGFTLRIVSNMREDVLLAEEGSDGDSALGPDGLTRRRDTTSAVTKCQPSAMLATLLPTRPRRSVSAG